MTNTMYMTTKVTIEIFKKKLVISRQRKQRIDLAGNSKYQSDDENEDDKQNVHDDKSYY